MTGDGADDLGELQLFIVQLGAAMNAAGEPVYVVQDRLTKMAAAYGARTATVSAFPTYLMVTMGRGEPAAVEITTSLVQLAAPRPDRRPRTICCRTPSAAPSAPPTGSAGWPRSASSTHASGRCRASPATRSSRSGCA